MSVSKQTARVVVIGAGAAGIAAATRLLEQGLKHVLLLEAENRVGGRVHTIPYADNMVDLGAQWCHGEQGNCIYETLHDRDALDASGDIFDAYKCVRSNGEVLSEQLDAQLKHLDKSLFENYEEELARYDGTLGGFLTDKFQRLLEKQPELNREVALEFFENLKKYHCSLEASDHLHELSGRSHLDFKWCAGDLLLNWKDKGFHTYLKQLMRASAKAPLGVLQPHVLLNHTVKKVYWQREQGDILVKCTNGKVIAADQVICTMSLGVLQARHKEMFTPALPMNKQLSLSALKLGTVDKFFMEFTEPFAPLDWIGFNFLWTKEDLQQLRNSERFWLESVFGFHRVLHQPRLLQGWIIGPHARYMETLTEKQVLEDLLWLFKRFLPFDVPQPLSFLRTQWNSNANFRGSYSFRTLRGDELGMTAQDLAQPLLDVQGRLRIQFAGEATSKHQFSTVHGAVDSGWREAQRLIDYYNASKSNL